MCTGISNLVLSLRLIAFNKTILNLLDIVEVVYDGILAITFIPVIFVCIAWVEVSFQHLCMVVLS